MELQQAPQFDNAAVLRALQAAEMAAETNSLVENGLTALDETPSEFPLAWVDELGQVWPHPVGANLHPHIQYLYSQDEIRAAMHAAKGIIVVQTVPSSVVPQVTGEVPPPPQADASPAAASKAARARSAMLATFANPSGAAVRSE